jgi:hypothetical protein
MTAEGARWARGQRAFIALWGVQSWLTDHPIAVGGTLILAITLGAVRFDPTVMIGALAAVIGGTVVFGSNTSTLKQTAAAMKAAEAHRAKLISRMDLRVVGEGELEI